MHLLERFISLWDKNQDGERAEQRSLLRVTLVALVCALLFLCLKRDSLFDWVRGALLVRRQENEIRANDARIREMDATLYSLTNNRDSLERFARERFDFAEKGEDVYIVDE